VARWLMSRDAEFDPGDTLKTAAPNTKWRTALYYGEVAIATIAVWLSTTALLYLLFGHWLAWLDHVCWPVSAIAALAVALVFNHFIGRHGTKAARTLAGGERAIVLLGAVAFTGISCCAVHYAGNSLTGCCFARPFGWLWRDSLGHLAHPAGMAIGLLSLTVLTIVVLGWIRWAVQPPPVQKSDRLKE
jgi:hypothetical protein